MSSSEEHKSSLLDLSNAPPLFSDHEMEVTPSGEKRKTTPPDLLTLSHMYFEKNQVSYNLLKRTKICVEKEPLEHNHFKNKSGRQCF